MQLTRQSCVCRRPCRGVGGPFSLGARRQQTPGEPGSSAPAPGPRPEGGRSSLPAATDPAGQGPGLGTCPCGPMSMWAGHHQGCLLRRDWPREGPVGGRPHLASSAPVPSLSQGPEVASSPRPRGPGCKAAAPACGAPGRPLPLYRCLLRPPSATQAAPKSAGPQLRPWSFHGRGRAQRRKSQGRAR